MDITRNDWLIGIWNMDALPPRFGGAITLAYELELVRIKHGYHAVKLCFLGNPRELERLGATGLSDDTCTDLSTFSMRDHRFLGAIAGLEPLTGILHAPTFNALTDWCNTIRDRFHFWPDPSLPPRLNYDSLLLLRGILPDELPLPQLKTTEALSHKAEELLQRLAPPDTLWVSVNLKNNPQDPQSNASSSAWSDFFQLAQSDTSTRFILVGTDPVADEIVALPHVFRVNEYIDNSAVDLAIIGKSAFFMGMANGPSQMAVLGQLPYVIFKHPEHHAEAMLAEMGDGEHFWLAGGNRRLIRAYEQAAQLHFHYCAMRNEILQRRSLTTGTITT